MLRSSPGKTARHRPLLALVLAAAAGCGDSQGDTDAASTGASTTVVTTTITTATVPASDSDSTVGTDSDAAPTGTTFSSLSNGETTFFNSSGFYETCRKVDVVFAIDNSGSMAEEIAALTGPVFDSFPASLLAVGAGIDDFHLAVMDACPQPANYHNWGQSGDCLFSTGANWMVSTSPTLTAEYQCVTELSMGGWNNTPDTCGTDDDEDEQPALAASSSLAPASVMGPNSGFLRDDALLLIVAITDEDEELFGGATVDGIVQQIVDAKGTIDEVIVLGIGGGSECEGPYGDALAADNLRAITQPFIDAQRGLFWDICQGNLETAFQQAIEIVDGVCNDVVPL